MMTVLQSKIRPKTEYEIMARINFNSWQDKRQIIMISVLRAWLNQVTKASACSKELLIRHRNALTEEAWEDTVQGVGNLCVTECEH